MGLGSSRCGCGKAPDPNLGGRIIKVASIPGTRPSLFHNCHGHMASTFGWKYLVCFYCNKKSGIKYNGLITQWECTRCDSMNFLDENGDITDPPVATTQASPADLTYSITRPESPLSQTSSQGSDSTLFCSTCLKNQHLFTASLAQYHVEIDPSHPEYKESENKYYKYRANLEKRYPQCCEDCQPKALERMKESQKTAKGDYARRLMDKSRARRSAVRGSGFTIGGALDFIGKYLWYIGLIGQLLWNLITVATIAEYHYATASDSSLSPSIMTLLSAMSTSSSYLPAGESLAIWGLWCSASALWWTPKFKNLNKGFMNQVTGYGDWYKHQFILFVVRCLFYFVVRKEDSADNFPAPTAAAHGFIFVFLSLVAIRSHRFIKVDMNKLWDSTPEKISFVGPRGSPNQSGNSMEDILNGIGATRSRESKPAFTPSPPTYREPFRPQPYQPGSIRVGHDRTAPIQSLKALDLSSLNGRTSPPLSNNTYTSASGSQPSLDQQYSGLNLETSMDWSPSQPASQPKSQHRAFTENLPVDKDAEFFGRIPIQKQPTKLFGQSPVVAQASTFWYKVPPAPITPAHQLRNPPNRPRMRVASQEQKETFFNVTRRSPSSQEPSETTASANYSSQRQGMDFAQQKFFAPSTPSEEQNDLVERFGGWSLADSNKPRKKVEAKNIRRHLGQGVALFLALLFWNHTMNNPSENTRMAALAIMFGCLCIGGRTVLDNTMWTMEDEENENVMAHTLGSILGGLEGAAAFYAMVEIYAGRGDCENCGSLGTILVGGMMVHQMWTASFG